MLISPIRPAERFRDLTPPEVADIWQVAQKVSMAIEHQYDSKAVTFNIQDGEEAGQSIQVGCTLLHLSLSASTLLPFV